MLSLSRFIFARRCLANVNVLGAKNVNLSSLNRESAKSYSTNLDNVNEAAKQDETVDSSEIHANTHKRLEKLFADEVQNKLIVPVFKKALLHGNKTAIKDKLGDYSFIQIYGAVKKLAIQISNFCGSGSQARVAFLCPNNVTYVIAQWACWFSGQIAVPLHTKHPAEILEYYLTDSDASLLITTPEYAHIMQPLSKSLKKPLVIVQHDMIDSTKEDSLTYLDPMRENVLQLNNQLVVEGCLNGEFYSKANALIMYTSGTTGKPKGVVLSYSNLNAQFNSLEHAWNVKASDSVLHVLPLNHIHGCINALNLPLNAGAKCIMLPHFDSSTVWSYILNVNMTVKDRINVFMGVPTIYSLLIKEYDNIFSQNLRMCEYIQSHCKTKIRLMISGSAPLPAPVFERWNEITGLKLLERYGMTEIGMALSNPCFEDKVRQRRHGCVGMPLPSVELKIVDKENAKELVLTGAEDKGLWSKNQSELPVYDKIQNPESISGHLYVKGPSVFAEYWQKPEETKSEFEGEWFKTGDTACYENGSVRILGRTSVDIIKSGGYKISALEIETILLGHPDIADIAVLGLPDMTWGQRVVAVVMMKDTKTLNVGGLKTWMKEKLPAYAIPTEIKTVTEIPRNAMGKVNKKEMIEKILTESKSRVVLNSSK